MSEYITGNFYLTLKQMQQNATALWGWTNANGWSLNATAGMLGNMQHESTVNPGLWQNFAVGIGPAYGLVQWDPFSKYINWCEQNYLEKDSLWSALLRIEYELANGIQYKATTLYPLSFAEFKVSPASPYYLGGAFLFNYERPAVKDPVKRGNSAEYWYKFLSGVIPPEPPEDEGFDMPIMMWGKYF